MSLLTLVKTYLGSVRDVCKIHKHSLFSVFESQADSNSKQFVTYKLLFINFIFLELKYTIFNISSF